LLGRTEQVEGQLGIRAGLGRPDLMELLLDLRASASEAYRARWPSCAPAALLPVSIDPLGDFRLNGLRQQLLSAFAKNAGQHILGAYGWQRHDRIATLSHWRIPGECGWSRNPIQTEVSRLFQLIRDFWI
jgi:hypothetical protein